MKPFKAESILSSPMWAKVKDRGPASAAVPKRIAAKSTDLTSKLATYGMSLRWWVSTDRLYLSTLDESAKGILRPFPISTS